MVSYLSGRIGGLFHFGSAAGGMSAARTLMLSSPYLPFGGGLPGRLKSFGSGAVVKSTARTSMLSSPCLVVLVVLGFGAGPPGVGFDGAAKAFGRTLKPAASAKVKMSFLYKVISLKI